MSFSLSQASLPVFEIHLNALSAILGKAEAYAAAKKIDPAALLAARHNAMQNQADVRFEDAHESVSSRYDIVLANILASPLQLSKCEFG